MEIKNKNLESLKKEKRAEYLLPAPLFYVPHYGAKTEVVYTGKERRMNCTKESLWL